MHGFYCACSFVLVYFCRSSLSLAYLCADVTVVYPETMGVPLEEMDAVFGEGKFIPQNQHERSLIYIFPRGKT